MDAKVSLPYGSGNIEFDVEGAASIETIYPNPMKEIAKLCTPEVVEHVRVLNHDCDADDLVYIGDTSRDYVSKCYEVTIPKDADVILCSAGGYPKDINLYQGCEGMLNVVEALRPGGVFFYACECREGGGPAEYFDWLKPLQEGKFEEALRGDFTIAGYIFFRLVEAAAIGSTTYLLTENNPEYMKTMGMIASTDYRELIDQIDFTGKKVYVFPLGGSVVPI